MLKKEPVSDKNRDNCAAAELRFKRINEAYEVLHDAKRRKVYEQRFNPSSMSVNDMFTSFFDTSFGFGGGTPRPPPPPPPPYPKQPDVIARMTKVKIFGLKSAADYNGKSQRVPSPPPPPIGWL